MTIFRSEDAIVGVVALATIPFVISILRRSFGSGSLPIGKSRIDRTERPGAFTVLAGLYVAAAIMMLYIGFDLLVGF